MDEKYLYSAVRYVERNPVRAGLTRKAEDYPWSSARNHVYGNHDSMVSDKWDRMKISDWKEYLAKKTPEEELIVFRNRVSTGRPLGDEFFIERLEGITGRTLIKKKPGPKNCRSLIK